MTLTALGMPALRSRTNGIADPRVVPTTGPLVDTFGRVANDLRVSLTDRCNLRCSYCMPERGLRWLPGEQLLRPDELARLIQRRPEAMPNSTRCPALSASTPVGNAEERT